MAGCKQKIVVCVENVLDFICDNFLPYRFLSKMGLRHVVIPRSFYFHYVINQKIQRLDLLYRMHEAGVEPAMVAKVWWSRGLCNFGDELMGYIFAYLVGADCKFDRGKALIGVGSTVRFAHDDSCVWGSGMMRRGEVMAQSPRVLAVRGPLTRQNLLDQDIDCPEVYGDPAMLFPLFYSPKKPVTKPRKPLIVPHFKHGDGMPRYEGYDYIDLRINSIGDIENIIDYIACASCVVTSSLHGFIFCVAYQIPVAVFKLEGYPIGGDNVKFDDFCQGVGINDNVKIHVLQNADERALDDLVSKARVYEVNWSALALLQSLYEAFPTPMLSGYIDRVFKKNRD